MPTSLSICIPVYNYNISSLIKQLIDQCSKALVQFEILVYDDGSTAEFKELNRTISTFQNIIYKELETNLGRSKIRNLLARNSNYDNLIFLDSDVVPVDQHLIKNYIEAINNQSSHVIVGGLKYLPEKDQKHILRWTYGTEKECPSLEERLSSPHSSFKTSNFFIRKSIFDNIQFDDNIDGYGHEDTYFGYHLKERKITISHIENPVYHLGLENAEVFISKTENALINLAKIYRKEIANPSFIEDVKILSFIKTNPTMAAIMFQKWRLLKAFYLKNLLSETPNLRFFDFYKLGFLMNELSKTGNSPT